MNTAVKEKTSLEWFFASSASSNFPQLANSSTLTNLILVYEKYVNLYFSFIPPDVDDKSDWIELARNALELQVKSRVQFTTVEGCLLLETLERFIDKMLFLKKSKGIDSSELEKHFKRLLTALIFYAKETSDVNFKSQVVDVVRRWEAAVTIGN